MEVNEFIKRLKDIALNYKTLYVMGCFGAPMTATNKRRYTANHEYNTRPAQTKKIMGASADTFGFDCVCLIKGVLWGWTGDPSRTYGGATYASNGVPDYSAVGLFNECTLVSSDFNDIVPGEMLYCPGHCGVYIGDGLAVECTPKWDGCVQITAVGNIGPVPGYNTRTWAKHGILPYISYSTVQTDKEKELAKVSAWAKNAWIKATNKAIIDGTRPNDNITRAEIVVMLDRLGLLD